MIGNGKTLESLARGFRKRTLVTARLASKTGLRLLKKTLNPDGTPAEVDEEEAAAAARELADTMGEMKGLVMKLGQMASYLEGSMPPAAQRVLAQLQARSTPLTYDAVAAVMEGDLGAPPDELFDAFERDPFAAASLGQVHRARVNGEDVAVKVQYPEIANALKSDLRTLGAMTRLSTMFSAVDGGGLIDELQTRMAEECDYRLEAQNQALFTTLLSAIEGAGVPRVIEARSGERVLTSALSDARSFEQFCAEASQEEKNRAAAIIYEVCFTCIFQHGVFNADPHPGNYLFEDGGDVVFLDFGCVKRFSESHMAHWKAIARAVLDDDAERFREEMIAFGLDGRNMDWDYQWNMMRYVYRPVLTEGFRFTSDYVKDSYDLLMFKNPNRFRMKMPKETLFMNRLQWGLYSVLSSLDATADWGGIYRRALGMA